MLRTKARDQLGERHVGEGRDAEIDVGKIMVDGGRAGARYGVNVGAGGGEAAGAGIFEGDGFGSAEAEAV